MTINTNPPAFAAVLAEEAAQAEARERLAKDVRAAELHKKAADTFLRQATGAGAAPAAEAPAAAPAPAAAAPSGGGGLGGVLKGLAGGLVQKAAGGGGILGKAAGLLGGLFGKDELDAELADYLDEHPESVADEVVFDTPETELAKAINRLTALQALASRHDTINANYDEDELDQLFFDEDDDANDTINANYDEDGQNDEYDNFSYSR